MAEWLNALPWKGSIGETQSGVRIPLSPRIQNSTLWGAYFAREERVTRLRALRGDSKRLPAIFTTERSKIATICTEVVDFESPSPLTR